MPQNQQLSRRGALECMLWAGTGVVWTVAGGIPRTIGTAHAAESAGSLTFAQISDSHIGFNKEANPDTPGTLQIAVDAVKALPAKPALMLHTGDVSHLSRPAEFDIAEKIITASGLQTHYVPGEHDMLDDDGKEFLSRFQGQGRQGGGFYSFDQSGVHFVGLNNVTNLKSGGLGSLGMEQLAWLNDDLQGRSSSQPIVVFAHIPLWTIYADWGWGTDDGAQVLGLLKRFGSVTVLNGHIHQVMQKVEGTVAFHTARSTAFPQPAPGAASSPGPMKVDAGRLRSVLGIATVSLVAGSQRLAIIDQPLGA